MARPEPEDSITHTTQLVKVSGKCAGPQQHLVWHDMPVRTGGRRGVATATTNCPACGAPVYLRGEF